MADYITYQPLSPPDELVLLLTASKTDSYIIIVISHSFLLCALSFIAQPKELSSPTVILKCQEGNSFNQACLLCSLLLGVGYDAYCVCGYAVREVTELDQRSKTCPLLHEREEVGSVSIASSLLFT